MRVLLMIVLMIIKSAQVSESEKMCIMHAAIPISFQAALTELKYDKPTGVQQIDVLIIEDHRIIHGHIICVE